MTTIVGPILICLGFIGLAYGIYLAIFSNRDRNTDRRSSRQKNLDAIGDIRGDKKEAKAAKPAKGAKPAKSKTR